MQHLEVSCAVRCFFKSLGFKGFCIKLNRPLVLYKAKDKPNTDDSVSLLT